MPSVLIVNSEEIHTDDDVTVHTLDNFAYENCLTGELATDLVQDLDDVAAMHPKLRDAGFATIRQWLVARRERLTVAASIAAAAEDAAALDAVTRDWAADADDDVAAAWAAAA